MSATFELMGGKRCLPWQLDVLADPHAVQVILGGFGSGKTTSAALALAVHAFSTPWRPEYGDTHPESLVIGKTDKVIKSSSRKALGQVIPRKLILREWRSPGERAVLVYGGHLIRFLTWSGAIEGNTVTAAWLDEAHLLADSSAFTNYVARMRDPLSSNRKLLVSGLPEFGWLQEMFGADSFPDSRVWHVPTAANTYLLPQDVARIRASTSAREAATYLEGKWSAPADLVFYEFRSDLHVIDWVGDRDKPVHIGVDIGSRSSLLLVQERDTPAGLGLHVVAELIPEKQSVEQIMRDAAQLGWRIQKGKSQIFVDPTTRADELESIARVFPQIDTVRKRKGSDSQRIEYGVRCVNAALKDADGNVRLTFSRELARNGRGILNSVTRYRRSEATGAITKDNEHDHSCDALRYVVAHLLPLQAVGAQTSNPGWSE